MDLTVLLIGTSVAAGAHIILFFGAATLAWVYFKRCKKLRAQIAQDEVPDDRNEGHRREGRDLRDWEPYDTDDYRRSRVGNRYRESMADRARRARRHQRYRQSPPQHDSSPYPRDDPEDDSLGEERREQSRGMKSKKVQDKSNLQEARQTMTA